MEIESKHTPEEMAKIQKERTLSDAELIKGGAEYRPTPGVDGKVDLEPTYEQKETIRLLRKSLSKEGSVYDDLATYIRLNKTIVLPKEEFSKEIWEEVVANKGSIWSSVGSVWTYIDKYGNVARIKIDPDRIKSLSKKADHGLRLFKRIQKELEEDGFRYLVFTESFPKTINGELISYRERIEKKSKDKKDKEFDF